MNHKKVILEISKLNYLFFLSRLNQIVNVAKRNPELIQLLEMHNQFKTISQYGGDVRLE